jgi:tripartite-type tricarboxylate transporter receptor subunit TctC
VKERLLQQGAEPVGSSPEQLAALIKNDIAKWSKVVKATGAKVE